MYISVPAENFEHEKNIIDLKYTIGTDGPTLIIFQPIATIKGSILNNVYHQKKITKLLSQIQLIWH